MHFIALLKVIVTWGEEQLIIICFLNHPQSTTFDVLRSAELNLVMLNGVYTTFVLYLILTNKILNHYIIVLYIFIKTIDIFVPSSDNKS